MNVSPLPNSLPEATGATGAAPFPGDLLFAIVLASIEPAGAQPGPQTAAALAQPLQALGAPGQPVGPDGSAPVPMPGQIPPAGQADGQLMPPAPPLSGEAQLVGPHSSERHAPAGHVARPTGGADDLESSPPAPARPIQFEAHALCGRAPTGDIPVMVPANVLTVDANDGEAESEAESVRSAIDFGPIHLLQMPPIPNQRFVSPEIGEAGDESAGRPQMAQISAELPIAGIALQALGLTRPSAPIVFAPAASYPERGATAILEPILDRLGRAQVSDESAPALSSESATVSKILGWRDAIATGAAPQSQTALSSATASARAIDLGPPGLRVLASSTAKPVASRPGHALVPDSGVAAASTPADQAAPSQFPGSSAHANLAPGAAPSPSTPHVPGGGELEDDNAVSSPLPAVDGRDAGARGTGGLIAVKAAEDARGAHEASDSTLVHGTPLAGATPPAHQLALRIARAVKDGVDRLHLRLEPQELGLVEVRLAIGPGGRVEAAVSADHAATLDLLRHDARELERALDGAGLRLESGGLSFSLRSGERDAHGTAHAAATHAPDGQRVGDATDASESPSRSAARRTLGTIDLFA